MKKMVFEQYKQCLLVGLVIILIMPLCLASLEWGNDEDLGSIIVETTANGGIKVTIASQHADMRLAKNFIVQLVAKLKEAGMSIRDELLTFNYDEHKLEIDFNGRFADAFKNGTLSFIEKAAKYCGFEVVNNLKEQLEDDEVHNLNITDTADYCTIENMSDIVLAIDIEKLIRENHPQIKGFKNVIITKNVPKINEFDLDDYFNKDICKEKFVLDINSEGSGIKAEKNLDNLVSFYPSKDFIGEEKIIVQITCNNDVNEDYFFAMVVEEGNENNSAPEFLDDRCGNINIKKNGEYLLNLNDCFTDLEKNNLKYRYSMNEQTKLSFINIDPNNYRIIPFEEVVESGFFYVYANDGISEGSGKINYQILEQLQNDEEDDEDILLEITSSSPQGNMIVLESDSGQTFSIRSSIKDPDSVEWYVNKENVKSDSLKLNFIPDKEGEYEIEVIITKNGEEDSKSWTVVVDDPTNTSKSTKKSSLLYIILGIIAIVIIIAAILIVVLRKSKMSNDMISMNNTQQY